MFAKLCSIIIQEKLLKSDFLALMFYLSTVRYQENELNQRFVSDDREINRAACPLVSEWKMKTKNKRSLTKTTEKLRYSKKNLRMLYILVLISLESY